MAQIYCPKALNWTVLYTVHIQHAAEIVAWASN